MTTESYSAIPYEPIEVLLVEDNPGDARLTQEILKDSKFDLNISVVADGQVAMSYLRQDEGFQTAARPDLVILDLAMPNKDGYVVLAEMNAVSELRTIPVMVLTSNRADWARLYFENFHPNRYCTKPLDVEHFDGILIELLDPASEQS